MLLSHRHGYLFVHLAKTGGTSIRAALSRFRWREPYAIRAWLTQQISSTTGHRIGAKIPRHAAVVTAREMLAPSLFASLFKFAFVRNPWDRMVSAYSHFQREYPQELAGQNIETFEQFAHWLLETPAEQAGRSTLLKALQRPQLESLIGIQGELLVDYVGRYERLESDFSHVLDQIPLPNLTLPHKRRSKRASDYRASYSDRLAELVGRHFADDITTFHYAFDPISEANAEAEEGLIRRASVGNGRTVSATIPLHPRIWPQDSEGDGRC